MSRFDPFRDWPKRGDHSGDPIYQAAGIMTDAAQILDVVSREWGKVGQWSEWDQSVRDSISAWLFKNTAEGLKLPAERGEAPARQIAALPCRAEQVDTAAFRADIKGYLTRAEAGEVFEICRYGKPIARLGNALPCKGGEAWSGMGGAPFEQFVLVATEKWGTVEAIQYRKAGWMTFGANGGLEVEPLAWMEKPVFPATPTTEPDTGRGLREAAQALYDNIAQAWPGLVHLKPMTDLLAALSDTPRGREISEVETPAVVEPSASPSLTDDQIKHMVGRFLAWHLPDDFNPDGGISYTPPASHGAAYPSRPVGTNLLTATQSEAMVRHMVEGLPR